MRGDTPQPTLSELRKIVLAGLKADLEQKNRTLKAKLHAHHRAHTPFPRAEYNDALAAYRRYWNAHDAAKLADQENNKS